MLDLKEGIQVFKSHMQLVATAWDSAGLEYFHSQSTFYWTALWRKNGDSENDLLGTTERLQTELGWDLYFRFQSLYSQSLEYICHCLAQEQGLIALFDKSGSF